VPVARDSGTDRRRKYGRYNQKQPGRSPGSQPRGTRYNGSITILRERISKWVLIDILNFFHSLSTVICKIHVALIRDICSTQFDRPALAVHPTRPCRRKDMQS
jgi:hypothetical protein